MGTEDNWLVVDDTGHVPGVAAELPHGHTVLLDAAGNIMAIVPVEDVPALEEVVAEQQADTAQDTSPDALQTAQQGDTALTAPMPEVPVVAPMDVVDAQPEPPVTEPAPSAQPDSQMSIQEQS
jgi:hypothetical protein